MASAPAVLALAGAGSDSGKTSLACALIAALRARAHPVGAWKIATATPDRRCERTGLPCGCLRFEGRSRLMTDACAVARPGKDSARLLAAGAAPVWWLQATQDTVSEATRDALAAWEGPHHLVVEGSAPLRLRAARLGVCVLSAGTRPPKPAFSDLLPLADALVVTTASGDEGLELWPDRAREAGLAPTAPIHMVRHPQDLPATAEALLAAYLPSD